MSYNEFITFLIIIAVLHGATIGDWGCDTEVPEIMRDWRLFSHLAAGRKRVDG